MSRKKRPLPRHPAALPANRPRRAAQVRPTLTPHPPRPNKLLLAAAALVLIAWMGFLLVLALLSGSPRT